MSADQEEITKLFKVRRTCLEMLRDRGFQVDDSEITMTRTEFIEKFRSGTDNIIKREDVAFFKPKVNDDSDRIYVFFPDEAKVGTKTLKTLIGRMHTEGVFRAILVVRQGLTPTAKKGITDPDICGRKFQLEYFLDAELVVNISRHKDVPLHELLSPERKKALLDEYSVKETQLPQIKITDPMAKYYGLKRGQVVKITRVSDLVNTDGVKKGVSKEETPESVTYRYVV